MKTLVLISLIACARASPFIMNGSPVAASAAPFNAAMIHNGQFSCGAGIISDRWVVTAAHCVANIQHEPRPTAEYKVAVGVIRIDPVLEYEGLYNVLAIFLEPNYSGNEPNHLAYPNDIALIEVSTSIQFTANTQANIYMAKDPGSGFAPPMDGAPCAIYGYGAVDTSGQLASELNGASPLNVITNQACVEAWQVQGEYVVAPGQFCMEDVNRLAAPCNGDSGSPNVCGDHLYTSGLVSIGTPGCTATLPSVYTRISYYSDWIFAITGVQGDLPTMPGV